MQVWDDSREWRSDGYVVQSLLISGNYENRRNTVASQPVATRFEETLHIDGGVMKVNDVRGGPVSCVDLLSDLGTYRKDTWNLGRGHPGPHPRLLTG